ncbi:hypothetical protein [uncultured Paenibacillus sp.]|uniref:hypothetical protein n=1 Tax=uncultured Paenibacillus sp. TaxID=227322 RepID=UPI0028D081C9|nr:hypothetical protein [uncultured Paenibacillus sp.]
MKRGIVISCLVLIVLFISACSNLSGKVNEQKNDSLQNELNDLQKRYTEMKEEKDRLVEELNKRDAAEKSNEDNILQEIDLILRSSEDIPAKVISESVENRKEIVAVPEGSLPENRILRTLLIIRITNQIIRDYPNALNMTIWEDEEYAKTYVKGDYDKEAPTGWGGLDYRAARIYKDETGTHLEYANSSDDLEEISFGMSKRN